jgi:hypothetical protein
VTRRLRRRFEETGILLFIATAMSLVRAYVKDAEIHRA